MASLSLGTTTPRVRVVRKSRGPLRRSKRTRRKWVEGINKTKTQRWRRKGEGSRRPRSVERRFSGDREVCGSD